MKNFILSFIIAIISIFSSLHSEQPKSITGKVFDIDTKEPIAGATIRIVGTNKGSYSSSRGMFKLPEAGTNKQIKVSSLGYNSKIIEFPNSEDTLFVTLIPSSVKKSDVTVTGEITADEVIKRAIERKNDNLSKMETFSGRLYSKMSLQLGGNIFATGNPRKGSVSMSASFGGKVPAGYDMFLLETFSDVWHDTKKNVRKTEILQRRQTANIQPNDNIMAISNFISFYNDELKFLNTTFETPLSQNAFSYYDFKLVDKDVLDDRFVYIIQVTPTTKLYPAFTGFLKIVEGTYNIVEAQLSPSESSAITFVENLKINQKYTESIEKIWYPSYLNITAQAKIDVIKGMLNFNADINATSIYSDVVINKPLPDSIYTQERKRSITVNEKADSAKPEFWEKNSMRELTQKEESIYKRIDSLIVRDSIQQVSKSFSFDYPPYFSFNRVGAISGGLSANFNFTDFSLDNTAYYSFGQKRLYGKTSLDIDVIKSRHFDLNVTASAFSVIKTISQDKSYPEIVNTVFSGLFHFDYYDYMRVDGWNINLSARTGQFKFNGGIDFFRNFSLNKTTNNNIYSTVFWRENPKIEDGDFRVANLGISFGSVSFMLPSTSIDMEFKADAQLGQKVNSSTFYNANGSATLSIPLFETGYGPVILGLTGLGGLSSDYMPAQYQFRMESNMLFINKTGCFFSANPGVYGGREFYSGHVQLNINDIWWRFLGLPTYEGRGLNLIFAGSYGRYFSKGTSIYRETGKYHYSEIGFGLSRIPTFISNVAFLSFDARWGVGPIASGKFGWGLSVSLPF